MADVDKQYLTWDQIQTMVAELADRCRSDYDVLLAVTRGGLVPTALLAYHLSLRNILVAAVQFYSGVARRAQQPAFLQFPADPLLQSRRVLIVDDIWDSGKTIMAVKERVLAAGGTAMTAVLHYKPDASLFDDRPDYFVEITRAWIVYPWETPNEAE
jgi:hypoxanthine phosphoribosyltransferase